MKTLTLSDHALDQVRANVARRVLWHKQAMLAHQAKLAAIDARRLANRNAVAKAWRNRSPLGLLVGISRLCIGTLFEKKPQPPIQESLDRSDIVWVRGREGEQKVSNWFSGFLDDDWTLVAGYKNRKGEIDQLLVGPGGLLAIEIKSVNGAVYCDGDRWWRDKFDNYGNLVESCLPMRDAGGRAPSRQLNDAADALQHFLGKRHAQHRIQRFVILAHEKSQLGRLNNLTVDGVGIPGPQLRAAMFDGTNPVMSAADIGKVLQIIRQDHAYHQRPATKRGAAKLAATG